MVVYDAAIPPPPLATVVESRMTLLGYNGSIILTAFWYSDDDNGIYGTVEKLAKYEKKMVEKVARPEKLCPSIRNDKKSAIPNGKRKMDTSFSSGEKVTDSRMRKRLASRWRQNRIVVAAAADNRMGKLNVAAVKSERWNSGKLGKIRYIVAIKYIYIYMVFFLNGR